MLRNQEALPSKIKSGKSNGFMENVRHLSFMEALNDISLMFTRNGIIFKGEKGFFHAFKKGPGNWGIEFQETGDFKSRKEIFIGIPAEVNYLMIPRLVVSGIGSTLSLTFDTIEDLKIALTEACNNVTKHAYQSNNSGKNIALTFIIEKGLLTMIVKDTGKGFDPKILKANNHPLGRGRGLGLFLIKSLMDEVELNSSSTHGTEIKMIKCLTN